MCNKDFKLNVHPNPIFTPRELCIIQEGDLSENRDYRTITSQEEMNQLLEEVKLYNSENEIKKRIISI